MTVYEVEAHNVSTGERRAVTVEAQNKPAAMRKALARKFFAEDLHSGHLWTFRVTFVRRVEAIT